MNRFFQRRERTGWRWLMLLVFAVLAAAGIFVVGGAFTGAGDTVMSAGAG